MKTNCKIRKAYKDKLSEQRRHSFGEDNQILLEEANSKAILIFINREVEHPVNPLGAENYMGIITVI